ncbi:hypothetical protein [Thalassobaculum litoreum]|uniref:Uncharacterized protein n=1 Tax=Thalassobaculum litoreum DSM 18839 TaxID=1123362 RepID=A0A8G2BI00_9PROT|nr:hypothetical protein [Thalassobaculum litoreum]SDF82827.1 hypothetical protein SAMN05660686_02437 [Thalassobaculum litoreum DSM 18839]
MSSIRLLVAPLAFAVIALVASLPVDRAYAVATHDPTVLKAFDLHLDRDFIAPTEALTVEPVQRVDTSKHELIGPDDPAAVGYRSQSRSGLTADNLPLRALEVAPYRSASVRSRH